MANQRKVGKKKIGFWATDSEKDQMLQAAKAAGFDNLADWIRSLLPNPAAKPPGKHAP